jgi:hypothetical protein
MDVDSLNVPSKVLPQKRKTIEPFHDDSDTDLDEEPLPKRQVVRRFSPPLDDRDSRTVQNGFSSSSAVNGRSDSVRVPLNAIPKSSNDVEIIPKKSPVVIEANSRAHSDAKRSSDAGYSHVDVASSSNSTRFQSDSSSRFPSGKRPSDSFLNNSDSNSLKSNINSDRIPVVSSSSSSRPPFKESEHLPSKEFEFIPKKPSEPSIPRKDVVEPRKQSEEKNLVEEVSDDATIEARKLGFAVSDPQKVVAESYFRSKYRNGMSKPQGYQGRRIQPPRNVNSFRDRQSPPHTVPRGGGTRQPRNHYVSDNNHNVNNNDFDDNVMFLAKDDSSKPENATVDDFDLYIEDPQTPVYVIRSIVDSTTFIPERENYLCWPKLAGPQVPKYVPTAKPPPGVQKRLTIMDSPEFIKIEWVNHSNFKNFLAHLRDDMPHFPFRKQV